LRKKTVGILGGMGPEATADLFLKIIKATPAKKDQEHLRIVVDNNPAIPDRTSAILSGGEDPTPLLVTTARRLVDAGAQLIVIPCNTAHYFHSSVAEAVDVPVLHMMEETACCLASKGVKRAGLLASSGTVEAQLYHKALSQKRIDTIVPSEGMQARVMNAIYAIKSGEFSESKSRLLQAAHELVDAGAGAVIAGCTEIPLVLSRADLSVMVIDATWVLAQAAVREALSQ